MIELEEKLKDFRLDDLLSAELLKLLKENSPELNINELILAIVVKIIKELETWSPNGASNNENNRYVAKEGFDCSTIINGLITATRHDLLENNLQMINALGAAIAERDSGTSEHNYRVTLYAAALAKEVGFSRDQIQTIIKGALIHDIGKIGIRDGTLLKKGRLSDSEYEATKRHVKNGIKIINDVRWLDDTHDIILYHHERYDGSGYLKGLKGTDIPINARIFAIADVFDSLTSARPYKKPYPMPVAMRIMLKASGVLFDPEIIHVFDEIAEDLYNNVASLNEEALDRELQQTLYENFDLKPDEFNESTADHMVQNRLE